MSRDGIKHDSLCEYASEACGCESREHLNDVIAQLHLTIANLKAMLPSGYTYKTYNTGKRS